ncbi:putative feruloyl esterase B [Cercospora beticola]|uniref:Carboxylic ester hydrolase n=1 Tax=Cercospora beticola TaxID=122368 RepID=A0A2G5H8N6_CERBT|nr:putative feruloyl esterase B [Cercospora beticola]PIA88891.1 putative feruloyl esterase B [Cercospora beticola]WPB03403.1 hypothetical protein RHO25_008042 [Cercospora beticola]
MRHSSSIAGTLGAAQVVASSSLTARCNSTSFADLDVFGAEVISVEAIPLDNYTAFIAADGETPATTYSGVNVCNLTITYTHPGRDDTINVNAWLPLDNWNGRFVASGGGGWRTGVPSDSLAPIASQGFATASTDGGHPIYEQNAAPWALNSPGNVNLNLFQDFASIALNDLGLLGKQATQLFYQKAADYSYWNGCSTGGRQGLMVAQRYPDIFDGILAIAPAINWGYFLPAEFWPQHFMNRLGYHPTPDELEAITAAAVEACDELDGVKDGIISAPDECHFDAETLVGQTYSPRNGTQRIITSEAARIANAAWTGPRSPNGLYDWYGLTHGTNLTLGLVATECKNESASSCVGKPFSIVEEWFKLFVMRDPEFDISNITDRQYFDLIHKSVQEYDSIIGTSDPDLEPFKRYGGKMITWHGLSDELIFPNGTVDYYQRVLELDPEASDFYRYFEAPGVQHCRGGPGPLPSGALNALISWVENGTAPETLLASKTGVQGGTTIERELCAWPKKQTYVGGDPNVKGSFECV